MRSHKDKAETFKKPDGCLSPQALRHLFKRLPRGQVVTIMGEGLFTSTSGNLGTGMTQTALTTPGLTGVVECVGKKFVVLSPTTAGLFVGGSTNTSFNTAPFATTSPLPVGVAFPSPSTLGETLVDLCAIRAVVLVGSTNRAATVVMQRFIRQKNCCF